jgi:heme/copper-type cytochrome/quinol oxidase subunit 2
LGTLAPAAVEEREMTISRQGFRPASISVRKGDTLRLRVQSADAERCFAVDAFRVEKRVRPGRATLVELVPDRAGRFVIHDCLDDDAPDERRGVLIVSE